MRRLLLNTLTNFDDEGSAFCRIIVSESLPEIEFGVKIAIASYVIPAT